MANTLIINGKTYSGVKTVVIMDAEGNPVQYFTDSVLTINGVAPDENGNVNIETGGVNEEQLAAALETALQEAKDSGEFTGPEGPQGPEGPAGPAGSPGVYVGSGEIPEGYYIQIDPEGDETTRLVLSVNGITPDEDGNVTISVGSDSSATIDPDDISAAVEAALQEAKDSGEFKGEKGDKGDTGDTGPQGPQGEKGDKGDTGDTGPQGEPGEKGDKGDKGDTGDTGPEGPQGPKGETGPQGPQGEKGADGTSVTILGSYNSEEELRAAHSTGSAGDAYLIEGALYIWSVTESDWCNVGTIQGPQGEPGEKGEKGDKGDTGDAGPQGEPGEKGEKGDKGDKGDTGDAGPEGPQGPKGDTGLQGEPGEKGEKGDKGDTGDTGPEGPQGPEGPAGADGKTPVKGTDYYTEADKAEMVDLVLAALPTWTGGTY